MKLLFKLAVLALVALGLAVLAGWFLVPPAAKGAVEQGSRYAFGVPTTLTKLGAKVGLGSSGIALEGYRVASPEGFDGKPLLEVGNLSFGVGTRSLLGEPKVIDEIVLEGLELHLIQKGTASNLLPVLQQVRRVAQGTAKPAPAPETGGESAPGPRLQIKRVRIADLAASVDVSGIPGLGSLTKRFVLPTYDADWTQLSGPNGLTVAEFAGRLLDDVSASAMLEADKVLPAGVSKILRASLEGGLEGGLGSAFDAAKGAVQDQAKQELDRAQDRVKEELEGMTEKGVKELDKLKESVGGQLGGALDGVLGGVKKEGDPKQEGDAAGAADGLEQKGAEELEKAKEKAGEKLDKALEGVLPGGAKKLFGKPGGGR